MHDKTARTEHRLRRFVDGPLTASLYRASIPVTITAWGVPDEPVPFAEAVGGEYRPFEVGTPWSKPWGTTWFHVTGSVPVEWAEVPGTRPEVVVDLGFNDSGPGFQAEGAVWRPDGTLVKGIEPLNTYVTVKGTEVDFYVEAAANPTVPSDDWVTPTRMGDKATAGDRPIYTLRRLELGLLDEECWELAQDVWALQGLMLELPTATPRRHEILAALEDMLDTVDPHDVAGTAAAARTVLRPVLDCPATASAHRVHAVGHAHIDSAWLWPVRETIRKCARTFSHVLDLMDDDPDVTFACSSAQQYAWMRDHYPELFERIRQRVAEGRFVPTGGMWVESDTNMPGGEALARQFVLGTRFFIDEFGMEPLDVWLPDSFGYTAAMPQIATASGKRHFLTQKISWNDTNTFPHHTFFWEGIDGTRIFTHFPPSDTYNSCVSAEELARAERQYAEKGRANSSLLLFGWGDGGGGPTREMTAAARRYADLEGSPRVEISTPRRFFESAMAEYPQAPVWSGEMYLEYHRGTYSSQHRTKQGNRRCEHLLREAELWSATAAVRAGHPYPAQRLRRVWEQVLLQQFHDILPGSSIAWVHREAEAHYGELAAELELLIDEAARALVGDGERTIVLNARPFGADGVPALGAASPAVPPEAPTVTVDGDGFVLTSAHLRVRVDAAGEIGSLVDVATGRELVAPGESAARLDLHRDIPNEWDAWDINDFYRHVVTHLDGVDSIEPFTDGERVGVRVTRSFSSSKLIEEITLDGEGREVVLSFDIDWHERQKLLKLVLPLDVHADRAASEIQFGHIERPTHANTSWDAAKFETVAHRWVHVGEPGFGVALANESSYGYDVTRAPRPGGGTTTRMGATMLRAPLFPDPDADQGRHTLRFAIAPALRRADAVEAGYRCNLPTRVITGGRDVEPLVTVDGDGVVVEAVKLAEDGSGDVIVRLYEALGARTGATVRAGFAAGTPRVTDLLERDSREGGDASVLDASTGTARLTLRPFQLVTVRIPRDAI